MSKKTATVSPWQILKFFWGYYMQKKRLFRPLFVLRILVPIVSLLPAIYYKELIDLISNFTGQDKMSLIPALMSIVLIIAGIQFMRILLNKLSDLLLSHLTMENVSDIYQYSFDYIQKHSYHFFTNASTGSLIAQAGKLASACDMITFLFVFDISSILVSSVFVIVASSFYNLYFGLIFFVWIVVFAIFQYYSYKRNYPYEVKVNKASSARSGYLSDVITNYFNVKIFSSYQKESLSFAKLLADWEKLAKTRSYRRIFVSLISSFLILICEVGMLYLCIRLWGIGVISLGTFILLHSYAGRIFDVFWGLGSLFRTLFRSFADAGEMIEVLQTPHEIIDKSDKSLTVHQGEIRFEQVDFSYGENQIFQGLTLHIKPGQRVALVGESGSGKTTITKLLFRFYDLQKGTILIDGQDISEITQDSLRASMSMVPQDPILFHRSLKENIAYGKPSATDEEIIAAAKMARCHEFVSHLKDGYETLVGERGVKLSGGERQRVAIARAILENKQIIVMDEATSALDSESEFLIQEAMEDLMRHKTVVIIAHRLSTIMKMDEIIVMDHGKIAEKGSHKELLAKSSGIYKKLREIQSGGFIGQ